VIRVSTRPDLRDALANLRKNDAKLGFVPTMGFLHEGHASLIRHARHSCDRVVVSLFVNPKQFGPNEDLERYPRDAERDQELCRREGVDILWMPRTEDVYPPGFRTEIHVQGLSDPLCGQMRPGHFTGVATVVARLLGLVRPDRAYFGQKDFQQWRILAQMVEDLALPVEIVRCPIVREPDGLALSSRNTYLSPEDRARALSLSRALARAMSAYLAGERQTDRLLAMARRHLADLDVEYLELRDLDSLQAVSTLDTHAVLAVAARLGQTRLIDNAILAPDSPDTDLPRLLEGAFL